MNHLWWFVKGSRREVSGRNDLRFPGLIGFDVIQLRPESSDDGRQFLPAFHRRLIRRANRDPGPSIQRSRLQPPSVIFGVSVSRGIVHALGKKRLGFVPIYTGLYHALGNGDHVYRRASRPKCGHHLPRRESQRIGEIIRAKPRIRQHRIYPVRSVQDDPDDGAFAFWKCVIHSAPPCRSWP